MKEWSSGAHSVFENGSEKVSALIFSLMSESWAKLKKLMSVEHVTFVDGKFQVQPKSKYDFLLIFVFRVYRSWIDVYSNF